MSGLLIFNPEHDFALAHGGRFYQPPLSIRKLRDALRYLPILWSKNDSRVLITDDKLLDTKSFKEVECNPEILDCISYVDPWGWDLALYERLSKIGISGKIMPHPQWIGKLRELSHRKISIRCNEFIGSPYVPSEIYNIDEAVDFAKKNPGCYFKMPWSSGGRGVVDTKELSLNQIREWVAGCIKKQGSVLAEQGIKRKLDFATLWSIENNLVDFIGFSVSISDGRGKYKGNIIADQKKIADYIRQQAPAFDSDIINRQKEFLRLFILPFYEGKLGIDMIAGDDGIIYPCSEINLRRTMGHAAIDFNRASISVKSFLSSSPLPFIFLN